ncbi:DUF3240 family protein [Sulfuriferula sp. GW1]|uniref:DUF3240 family protein n=1 Tax=Sulfuriferula sp. GW1 TaxID=3345111 RepID=UPI0039AECD7C
MSELCLTLLCPPALEEKLLDMLLMAPEITVFTSTPTAAHGSVAGNLSPAEQVLGRAIATQVQVLLAVKDKDVLLNTIQQQFAGTGMRYWLAPILEQGVFA